MGFKDAALPMKEQALARRIGEEFAAALAEDRMIRSGQIAETWTAERIEKARR